MYFFLNGVVHKQHCLYWSDENLCIFIEIKLQDCFSDSSLIGELHLNKLENTIELLIVDQRENQIDPDRHRV